MQRKRWEVNLEQLAWKTEDLEETLQNTYESADNAGSIADSNVGFIQSSCKWY